MLQRELEQGEAEKLQNSAFCCGPMLNILEKRKNKRANLTNLGPFLGEISISGNFPAWGSKEIWGSVRKGALIAAYLTECLHTEHKSCIRQRWPCPLAQTWKKFFEYFNAAVARTLPVLHANSGFSCNKEFAPSAWDDPDLTGVNEGLLSAC